MAIRTFRGRLTAAGRNPPITRRLFCFPYAGAGAAIYRLWPDHLPSDVELCIPCLPARDARVNEPPCFDMATLVASLGREILQLSNEPYALFGHSMGAFIAFDLAHELSGLGRPPSHLFVSAQRGPSLPYAGQPIFALPDDEFLEGIQSRYNRIPQLVLEQKELMTLLLRAFRMDFALTEDYRYRAASRLGCPLTVFGGSRDPQIDAGQLQAWSQETRDRFRLHMLTGGHFFIDGCREELVGLIRAQMEE